MNESKNTTYVSVWDAAKAVLWGKFIAVNVSIRKEERFQVNNLSFHLKKLEREAQTKPKADQGKDVIKRSMEIYEIKNRKKNGENQ